MQARARDVCSKRSAKALENAAGALGVEDSLIEFEGLTPQMIEALAKDDVKTLEDFATCADWELAGGWTTVDGERVKDDGVLEPFDVSLEEAQDMDHDRAGHAWMGRSGGLESKKKSLKKTLTAEATEEAGGLISGLRAATDGTRWRP